MFLFVQSCKPWSYNVKLVAPVVQAAEEAHHSPTPLTSLGVKMDSYDIAKSAFKGSAKEWLESQERIDAIQQLDKSAVKRRRFEKYRQDM